MMQKHIFLSLPIEDFKDVIKSTIKEVLEIPHLKLSQESENDYYTRKQTSEKLHISLGTLDTYTKKGLLTAYKVGHRILYKKLDINDSLVEKISNKKYRLK